MLKKIMGMAVLAVIFSCSSDDPDDTPTPTPGPSSTSGGDPSSSSDGEEVCTVAPCGERRILADFNGTATTRFGSWAYVYADDGATIDNAEDTEYGGYIGMVNVQGRTNKAAQLTNFNAEVGNVGIGIDVKGDGIETEPRVSLDTIIIFSYEYKGAAHHFRMQKEAGVFWMQKVPASEDWTTVYIFVDDEENFVEGEVGLGPYERTEVESIQWVPDIEINATGTLTVDNFYGYAK